MPLTATVLPKTDSLIRLGTNCPFCGFPFHPGDHVISCPADNTPHHVTCWQQNGNHCTLLGCTGAGEVVIPVTTTPPKRTLNNALTVIGIVLLFVGVVMIIQNPPSFLKSVAIANPTSLMGRIAFYRDDGPFTIYTMNTDGTDVRMLTQYPRDGCGNSDPAWSPDGQSIAFSSERQCDGRSRLYVMNSDGTNQYEIISGFALCIHRPSWSPDGRSIVFGSGVCGYGSYGLNGIYVVNLDGTNLHALSQQSGDSDPTWSPDRRWIAFTSKRDGNDQIYIMNSDGTNQYRLTSNSMESWSPAWSPDGRYIAFTGNDDIFVMNADGTNAHRIYDSGAKSACCPTWSPDGQWIAFTSNLDGQKDTYIVNLSLD